MAASMDFRREHVMSRRDVAIVGGSFGQERTLSFGDESFVVRSGDGEIRIGLFANALEVTDEDGSEALYLFRELIPATYRKVEVGKAYAPEAPKRGKGKKGKASRSSVKSPVLESFPVVTHSTDLTLREMAERMASDGTCSDRATIRPAVLFVILSQGVVPDDEWDEEACLAMLASMRSGDLSSATLNQDGRMSVEVVARVVDVPALATESVIAMDAYCRRMDLLLGHCWEEKTGQDGMMRFLSGNTLWTLVPFLLRWAEGTPRHVAEVVLPAMRLRRQLSRHLARHNTQGAPVGRLPESPVGAKVEYDGMRSLGIVVSLVSLMDPADGMSVDLERVFMDRDGVYLPSLATELGTYVTCPEDARHLLSFADRDMSSAYDGDATMVCLTALLGSDDGRRLVTEHETGRMSVAAMVLAHAAKAFTKSEDAWGDWVAGQVRDIVGSVAYAEAVAETVPVLCDTLGLSEAWDVIDPDSQLGVGDASPDWARLAEGARRTYAEWRADKESRPVLGDFYDDWGDWDDDWESWDDYESCLYSAAGEDDRDTFMADRFVELCRLVRACRHSFRHLDAMGWRTLLGEIPELRLLLEGDGTPRPLHNDVVAAAYEAFHDLVTEDGYDEGGNPVGIRIPRVVMGDGSVAGFAVEGTPDGEGYVGRITCDGGNDCYLLPADMGSFGSAQEIAGFVFEVCVATDGEDDATGKPGDGEDVGDATLGDSETSQGETDKEGAE